MTTSRSFAGDRHCLGWVFANSSGPEPGPSLVAITPQATPQVAPQVAPQVTPQVRAGHRAARTLGTRVLLPFAAGMRNPSEIPTCHGSAIPGGTIRRVLTQREHGQTCRQAGSGRQVRGSRLVSDQPRRFCGRLVSDQPVALHVYLVSDHVLAVFSRRNCVGMPGAGAAK